MCLALPSRLKPGALFLLLIPLAVGCGGEGGTDVVLPSLSIRTSTTGVELDPDGYDVRVDGQASQPIGLEATLTVDRLGEGQHTVELSGIAPNCSVGGENPRAAAVSTGATATVVFSVVCSATSGTLEVVTLTTGEELDPDGFVVTVDGSSRGPIGANATASFGQIAPGLRTVGLTGLASNCQVTGDSPVGVQVPAGETARVSFAITCAPTVGQLAVTISGLPGGIQAAVTVAGPNNFSQALSATQTLAGLAPGSYSVNASNVVAGQTTYTPSVGRPVVQVVAGGTAAVTVSYTSEAVITLNLRIDGLYITQSTQTYGSDVPLVAGRESYLRVFVVANESNSARPGVRVRLSRPGAPDWTRTISAPRSSTPTEVQEGALNQSWNLRIPASQIQPGLTIEAEVDQAEAIEESNEGDNRFPASGIKEITVGSVPAVAIRFVRVLQTANNLEGVVGSTDGLMSLARGIYPLNSVQADVRETVFSTAGPLLRNGEDGWNQLLSDLEAARVAEAPDRTYVGIVKLDYGRADGVLGVAFQEVPTALSWDDPGDADRIVAHELGHTWGRRHSPCGGPSSPSLDQLYPYPGGQIGVYGMDVGRTDLKSPSSPDIMGYCLNPWISDYTYRQVMAFRAANAARAAVTMVPQPSVLVWGRIVNGRPVLEPAFQIVTRPRMPSRPGPYSVTGTALDGSQLFTLSFEAATTADNPGSSGHFAFAVPLDRARASRLASLRLAGPGGVTAAFRAPPDLMMSTSQELVAARREGQTVALRWNASVHPTIMVRDPDTGEVLSFVRGGSARVLTTKGEVDLVLSDGVQSQRLRKAISRP